jgi:hypothetical protein
MHPYHACKNCGHAFEGKFCNACGEKLYTDKDKSVKHLLEEAFHFLTHFDSKFFTTMKLVLFKTGHYSREYCEGRRKKYFKPVSLFLIVVILYFLFPRFKGLNMTFGTYMAPEYGYRHMLLPAVKWKLAHGMQLKEMQVQYDNASPKLAKFLLLLLLPLTAFVFQLLFYKRRRYFFDHFILSTEIITFFITVIFLVTPLLMVMTVNVLPGAAPYFTDGGPVFMLASLVLFLATFLGFRRFYHEHWAWTLLKTIIFLFAFNYVIKFIYNIVLFLLVMLFVH